MRPAPAVVAIAVAVALGAPVRSSAQETETLEFRTVGMFNQHLYYGSFSRPRGLAFDREHGELWVADTGNALIGIYRPDGAELFAFTAKGILREPSRISVGPKGSVAVIEGDRSRVRLFNYRGDYKGDRKLDGMEERPLFGAIAFDSEGNFYVAENRSGQIFVYAPDGKLKRQFGSRGDDEGQFEAVCGIAVAADGTTFVADQQAIAVQVFDNQGNFIRGWGKHEMGSRNFSLPSGIALDSKGRVYVSDELRHQVKIFSAEGELLSQFGGLGGGTGQISFPSDIVIDGDDRIYVCERQNSRVQVFAAAPSSR